LKSSYRSTLLFIVLLFVVGLVLFIFNKGKSDISSSPSACVNNSISEGASGHCVSDLQNLLNWGLYGIDQPNYIKVTGQFSTTTTSQVKKFQTYNNLTGSGVANVATWKELCSEGSDASNTWLMAAQDAGCKT
jgi:hypothetical protein